MRIMRITILLAALLGMLAGCGKEEAEETDSRSSKKPQEQESPTPPPTSPQEQQAKDEEQAPGNSVEQAEPAPSYSIVESWPEISGQALAVDSKGNLFVVLSGQNKIRKYDPSGKLVGEWGSRGSGDGQFGADGPGPDDVAVDSEGNVFVVDSKNNRIQKLDPSGKFLTKWVVKGSADEPFRRVHAIAVDLDGNVFFLRGKMIQTYDRSGNPLTEWDAGDGSLLTNPYDIAVDSKRNAYVLDSGTNSIRKFDSSGKLLTEWGSIGSEDGELMSPSGIAVDLTGNVYVADTHNGRIQTFDSSGEFLAQWSSKGYENRLFDGPFRIAVDHEANVFVCHASGRIRKFALEK